MSDSRKSNKKLVTILIIVSLLLIVVPFIALKGAEFGGSDDAGSQMVNEVTGKEYTPWFTPILENFIGGEIPGEIESLIFCVQTGIGVGIISYCFGYLAARKKYMKQEELKP